MAAPDALTPANTPLAGDRTTDTLQLILFGLTATSGWPLGGRHVGSGKGAIVTGGFAEGSL